MSANQGGQRVLSSSATLFSERGVVVSGNVIVTETKATDTAPAIISVGPDSFKKESLYVRVGYIANKDGGWYLLY